jgi:hypothetical protein
MGFFKNIKTSIDDKSSMSVNNITVLASAVMGVIVGLVLCYVLIYDVTYDGKIDTDMGDMAMLLMASGVYILGSGAPKAYVDSRIKTRSWAEGEKLQVELEEDMKDYRTERKKKRSLNKADESSDSELTNDEMD